MSAEKKHPAWTAKDAAMAVALGLMLFWFLFLARG